MSKLIIVVEEKEDWAPYYPSKELMTFTEYINLPMSDEYANCQVINLCRDYRYQKQGYYCSLFAEAVEHKVIPSLRAINDLSKRSFYSLDIRDLDRALDHTLLDRQSESLTEYKLKIYFGRVKIPELSDLARKIFDLFPFPALEIHFTKSKIWHIESIKHIPLDQIEEDQEEAFAEGLDQFSSKVWRKPRAKKVFRYSLAILQNPEEKMAPSNSQALKQFIKSGKSLGVEVDLITKQDYPRLPEYDALFIRETTSLNHHTYMFAKKAESEGLVVIDDPTSILRCTNKVFLHKVLAFNDIDQPKSMLLEKGDRQQLKIVEEELGFPCVLKIPDGSFSVGVVKVKDQKELKEKSAELLKKSAFILVQEYLYTDYDWRIGVLNEKPLFACKYFMSKGHWQIYNHKPGQTQSGKFETMGIPQVPKKVIKTALKAANLIGNGLYGVDLKEVNGRVVVIEVNDNPNLDRGVEDLYLGEDLYLKVLEEFIRRLNDRGL
jgi:glutathione synthase/RimK-type ligase-like ATP-grasp enzyme